MCVGFYVSKHQFAFLRSRDISTKMKRVRSGHEEDDNEDASIPERRWQDIPRNAKLTEAETLTFFSEFTRATELTDEDVIQRCNFLMRHAPPNSYLSLKIKGKFVQLIKRLEKVCNCYVSPPVERSLMLSNLI